MKTTDAYKWVDLRLREAVKTIKLLPLNRHDLPDGVKSAWPSYARAVEDAYGYEGDPEHPLIPKDTDEQKRKREDRRNSRVLAMQRWRIRRMNEVLDWMWWLTIDEHRIVWARAEGISWQDLEDHRSIRTLQRVRDRALGTILFRLYG